MAQTTIYINEMETQMPASPKRLARSAGVLYLFVGIFGGFAEGFVEPRMYAAGNAATTAGNVVANAGLVRLGVVADLLDQTIWIFLGLTLYLLLKHVNKSVAMAMVVLVAIGAGITCLNMVFEFVGLRAATGAVNLAAFGTAGSNAIVLLLLDTQHYGIFIAQIFFGLWLIPLGYLAYKSAGWFPKWLGVLLIVGGACYLVDLFAQFLVPDFGKEIHSFILIPSALAEISMVVYLLVIGVRIQKPDERISATLRDPVAVDPSTHECPFRIRKFWSRLEGLTITLEDDSETLLTGPVVDQAALHGLRRSVRDVGMPLLSVTSVRPDQADG